MALNSTQELIDDVREGRMIIIMDDEDRENEGDFIIAASHCTPEHINFMAKHGRGLICLTLTWANPHVYLDTVLLIGSIGTQYAPNHWSFATGAILGSLSFFVALGFGARLLSGLFENPKAWVVLEVIVGCTMWAIAASLLLR